ncbi:hypothetical protein [Kitasatospora sp. GAS1066B]|uniref:hypothetical protein n=1 Tax=Kitasatospora sp. GAS1066B TaxID=3156271 RepID=UPI003516BFF7
MAGYQAVKGGEDVVLLGLEDRGEDLGAGAAVQGVDPQPLFLARLGVDRRPQLPDGEDAESLASEVAVQLLQHPPAELLVAELLA